MFTPNKEIVENVSEVCASALDADDFLRASGELFATCDSRWQKAVNAKLGADVVGAAIADLVYVGNIHVDAIEMCGLSREAMPTILTVMISADMCRVDVALLGKPFVDLHLRYLKYCARLLRSALNDPYMKAHAEMILIEEAAIFIGVVETVGCDDEEISGYVAACNRLVGKRGKECGDMSVSEMYVDMFSRLHSMFN